jgi:proline racemase
MDTGKGDRQMSREWVDKRLDKKGLEKQDVANIRAGLESPGKVVEVKQADGSVKKVRVRKIYAQTDPSGTKMNEINNVGDTEVKIGPSFDPFK